MPLASALSAALPNMLRGHLLAHAPPCRFVVELGRDLLIAAFIASAALLVLLFLWDSGTPRRRRARRGSRISRSP